MNRRRFFQHLSIAAASITLGRVASARGGGLASENMAAETTEQRVTDLFRKAEGLHWSELAVGDIMVLAGSELLGTPYVGATLEAAGPEAVQLNMMGLDCVTFFENCLAFARCVKLHRNGVQAMKEQIALSRYRDGVLRGYTSRLHYTAEWISNNESKGVVKNISSELQAEHFNLHVDFMSKHPQYYKALQAEPGLVEVIERIEKTINNSQHMFIPKERVASIEDQLQNGDIIAIATSKKGLDYAHTGMIKRINKKSHFLHASLAKKEVWLDAPLSEYLQTVSSHIGISVARPLEPKQ